VPTQVLSATSDPAQGVFTLSEALDGLPAGPGPLRALIETDAGVLVCTLRPDKAPNGVANFVGLARGRRPFLDPVTHNWTLRRFYDGLLFHRVLAGVLIEGGDPQGNGVGGPGYTFRDEISDLTNDAGALGYGNAGPNSNGSQFYVTETAQPSFDGSYTVFGTCEPILVVSSLSLAPVDANDKPLNPEPLRSVKITRCGN
jgi:peptidyl-prolyl cis-trans isomerase A (cyclophilin A)